MWLPVMPSGTALRERAGGGGEGRGGEGRVPTFTDTTPRVSVNTRGNSFSTNVGKTCRPAGGITTAIRNNY